MASNIGQQVYASSPTTLEPFLQLNCDEYVKTMVMPSSWNVIKVGILCSFRSLFPMASLTYTSLVFGLCQQGRPYTSRAANFFGWYFGGGPSVLNGVSWTLAGSTDSKYLGCSNYIIGSKIGSSFTTGSNGSAYIYIPVNQGNSATTKRGIFTFYVAKGAAITATAMWTTPGTFDCTMGDLYNAMDQNNGTIVIQGSTLTATNLITAAYTEAIGGGPLDTLNIYWNRASVALQIYAVNVQKLS
jgi:hypothetical protein